jgi:23S rRNA A2030 N6-methylase RlmJ
MPVEKMYEILGQLKTICMQNREQSRELFATHPHLALAVMRMQDRLQKINSQPGGMAAAMGHDRLSLHLSVAIVLH